MLGVGEKVGLPPEQLLPRDGRVALSRHDPAGSGYWTCFSSFSLLIVSFLVFGLLPFARL